MVRAAIPRPASAKLEGSGTTVNISVGPVMGEPWASTVLPNNEAVGIVFAPTTPPACRKPTPVAPRNIPGVKPPPLQPMPVVNVAPARWLAAAAQFPPTAAFQ